MQHLLEVVGASNTSAYSSTFDHGTEMLLRMLSIWAMAFKIGWAQLFTVTDGWLWKHIGTVVIILVANLGDGFIGGRNHSLYQYTTIYGQ